MKIILIALLSFLQISTVMGQTNDFTEEMNNPKNHTVESYLKASKEQGWKNIQKEGLFFYGLVEEYIPTFVLFVPCELKKGQLFEQLVKEVLSNEDNLMYKLPFSNMVWHLPNLGEVLASVKYHPASFTSVSNGKTLNGKVSYGRFTFNVDDVKEAGGDANPEINKLLVNYQDETYLVKETDNWPREFGISSLFEKVDFD